MKHLQHWKVILASSLLATSLPWGFGQAAAAEKVVTSHDYKLTITYDDKTLEPAIAKYTLAFKRSYWLMAKAYSPQIAPNEVFIRFVKNSKYPIAYTVGNTIYINPDWAKKNQHDEGMLVHELFHVVDAYPNQTTAPSWVKEGLADYARSRYHIKKPGTMLKIHQKIQQNQYSEQLFKEYTGKTVDQLWAEYKKNPGSVEALNWVFKNNKARYNGEQGAGKWVTYFDFNYVPGSQNYLRVRNMSKTQGTVTFQVFNKKTGKAVRTYSVVLKANEVKRYDPLSKALKEPPKGNYTLRVKIPKGMKIDFELNYGNQTY
ncbi:uncharacterized protein DUF4157 [Laceyella sediminis]|uniref:Uncharacterized protein DUF4157 n=1 Tax=Laceyella sediminis TaxID=573074 RepID=A0ABX5ERE6_9BACL|nr:DUF4157 domain-containing protein [Laceyella sediminis]PRZ15924.1 uncharacterized protein DUF4157 [Laceyella sediminis]